ncbi:MAG: metallophosphoesterase family protein [Chloroflexota bacterium]|nr:metallophosphoesterase family protein [Chloroflexota bacterium]
MRYAILADIHSNLVAFQTVLADIETKGGCDEIWCLGDVVGYGPEPHACIELLRSYKHVCVAGNHDLAASGRIGLSDFNSHAARACQWTAQQLNGQDIDYLRNLPKKLVLDDFTLVHGSPRYPIWEYLLSASEACDNFSYFDTNFCLVGHSHVPSTFRLDNAGNCFCMKIPGEIKLNFQNNRLIINPGGVGQPRDGDPRASYIMYDNNAQMMYHYRIHYDIGRTQKKMTEYKLPSSLILRLNYGY